jgi:AbrB family transcriptional regulator (stage V sporulation protein T)
MKSIGIVRKIDELGRIVIPKEIRKTMQIQDGDSLEIFTDSQGDIVFKKYAPVSELSAFAQKYADILSKYIDLPMLVCDLERVVSVAGVSRNEYLNRRISLELKEYMQSGKDFISTGDSEFRPVEGMKQPAAIMCPVIAFDSVVGAVVLLNENDKVPDSSEVTLVQVATTFLGKQMEE